MQKLGKAKSAKILDFESLKEIDKKPGVYVITYVEMGKPKNFTRLNGIDSEGILCIGRAINLNRRIREFQKDIMAEGLKEKYHSEGWNFRAYFRDNPNPNTIKLKVENVMVHWIYMKDEQEADNFETELIQQYVTRFQDKPPLNISIKRKR